MPQDNATGSIVRASAIRTAKSVVPTAAHLPITRALDRVLPGRRRQRQSRLAEQARLHELAIRVSPSGRVLGGIFEGLQMPDEMSWGSAAAYLSGTYEEELRPWMEQVLDLKPTLVVDVGAAEGYYAVGLARLLPDRVVHGFDIDRNAQKTMQKTAALNNVTNVRVHGKATAHKLQELLEPGSFVVCDCEGYEAHLLDPEKAPTLRSTTIIVELHDVFDPTITDTIVGRFQDSHVIEIVDEADKSTANRPQLGHLSETEIAEAINERRPRHLGRMRWAVMVPVSSAPMHPQPLA